MPSAASVKVEKPPTTNISANNAVAATKEAVASSENVDNSSPVRQISLIIEHKIRNLEKRKVSQNPKKKKTPKPNQSNTVILTCVSFTRNKKNMRKKVKRRKRVKNKHGSCTYHVCECMFFLHRLCRAYNAIYNGEYCIILAFEQVSSIILMHRHSNIRSK